MRLLLCLFIICVGFIHQTNSAQAQVVQAGPLHCLTESAASPAISGPFGGEFIVNSCNFEVGFFFCLIDNSGNCSTSLPQWNASTLLAAGTRVISFDQSSNRSFGLLECPLGTGPENSSFPNCVGGVSALGAALLPNAAAAKIGSPATAFASIVNSNVNFPSQTGCKIALGSGAPTGLTLTFQETNPSTNQPIGQPNIPVTIASNASQSFVLTFNSNSPFSVQNLPLMYTCGQDFPAPSVVNVNTIDLTFSSTFIPNIVALAATPSNDGVLRIAIAQNPTGAFAIATSNSGVADNITVQLSTGNAVLPLTLTMCQTNSSTGQCLATPSSSVTVPIAADATPTFSVFATALQKIPFSPSANRIIVQFLDSSGAIVGATSVAVTAS